MKTILAKIPVRYQSQCTCYIEAAQDGYCYAVLVTPDELGKGQYVQENGALTNDPGPGTEIRSKDDNVIRMEDLIK